MIYVCADWHFGHNKPFLYEGRGFSSIQEHDEALIKVHNEIVKPDDVVYVLGDLTLGDAEYGLSCIERMNGALMIAIGNHDTNNRIATYQKLTNVLDVEFGYRLNYKHTSLWLSHYPMIMKNFEDPKPTWNISGHTHASEPFLNGIYNAYCVSMDAIGYKPIALDDIIIQIKNYERIHYGER